MGNPLLYDVPFGSLDPPAKLRLCPPHFRREQAQFWEQHRTLLAPIYYQPMMNSTATVITKADKEPSMCTEETATVIIQVDKEPSICKVEPKEEETSTLIATADKELSMCKVEPKEEEAAMVTATADKELPISKVEPKAEIPECNCFTRNKGKEGR
jgi:hypothetical protein